MTSKVTDSTKRQQHKATQMEMTELLSPFVVYKDNGSM